MFIISALTGDGSSGNTEPVITAQAVTEVLRTIFPVLLAFGLIHWSDAQLGLVYVALSSVLGFIQLLWTRARVTPVVAPTLPAGTVVTTTNEDGPTTSTTLPTNGA